MSKEVRVRLYRIQDYDLYTLYFDKDFRLGKAFQTVVNAYANGEPAPVIPIGNVAPLPNGKPARVVTSFTLEDDDTNALNMLIALSKNKRNANNFVKHLLRRSLSGINKIYFQEEDQTEFPDTGFGKEVEQLSFRKEKKKTGVTNKEPAAKPVVKKKPEQTPEPVDIPVKEPKPAETPVKVVPKPEPPKPEVQKAEPAAPATDIFSLVDNMMKDYD